MKKWLSAFRLRTLPLAFSCIITGSALADKRGAFDLQIFILAIITTLFLQILSNLANDYGDAQKGTDNENRVGPTRAIQSGEITAKQMKKAIVVFVVLSLISGLSLVFSAFGTNSLRQVFLFIGLGILSIFAAIKYTAGKRAYGYAGLGDLSVFLFFGIVGVIGSSMLYDFNFDLSHLLPATTIGVFSAAVLNLNNMRDIENDRASGKNTLVVIIGPARAKKYHFFILIVGVLLSILFVLKTNFKIINLLFIISFLPILIHLVKVVNIKEPKEFDPELKKMALSTFLFSILFWISINL